MKKILCLFITCVMLFSMSATAFAADSDELLASDIPLLETVVTTENVTDSNNDSFTATITENLDLEVASAYEAFCEYVSEHDLPVSVSLETFTDGYYQDEYVSVDEYLQLCLDELSQLVFEGEESVAPASAATSSDDTWFYNTSTQLYQKPNYSKYNLLEIVKPGDIVFEAAGGSGLTGHCVIVEGIYYSSEYAQYYIRIVEAIGYLSGSVGEGEGVCRGILDDDRLDSRRGTILRVNDADDTDKTNAIAFCVSQIGKEYEVLTGGHSTASTTTDWYCSELVWAAYYNQDIDLESSRGVWITPDEILESSGVTAIDPNTIGTPTITSITATSQTSATISWGAVSGATKYEVYRATSASGQYTKITTTTGTSFTNTGLTSGSTYYYRVAAYNASGLGNKSSVKAVRLSFTAPTITASYTPTSTSAYLEWSTVYNASGYYVYRSTSATGTYTKIATTANRYYTNSGLTSGTTYYYKIVAYNSSSTSSYSSYKAEKPVVVDVPVFYYSTADSSSKVTIRWTNVPSATKYYVYRSTSATGTYTSVGNTNKTTYTDTGLSSGTSYYYKIRAYYNGTYSEYSSYRLVTTD